MASLPPPKNPAKPWPGVALTKPESKNAEKLWKLPGSMKPPEEKCTTFHI